MLFYAALWTSQRHYGEEGSDAIGAITFRSVTVLLDSVVCSMLVISGIGTICCGIAPSMETLITARAIAGMGGGG